MAVVERLKAAPDALVTATILADIAFLFALTLTVSGPSTMAGFSSSRSSAFICTEFYFGRGQAVIALMVVSLGYLTTVSLAIRGGTRCGGPKSSGSLGVFLGASALFVFQLRKPARRLANIARLMEHAEAATSRWNTIVKRMRARRDYDGRARAYNRVRSQLSNMVLTDPLTGCMNRRGSTKCLRARWRARRAPGVSSHCSRSTSTTSRP